MNDNQKPLTEKRRANRKIVSSELRKLRYQAEDDLERETGVKGTYIERLCLELFGDYYHSSRNYLGQLERGSINVDIGMFYRYLKTIGYKDKDIQDEFFRIVRLLV